MDGRGGPVAEVQAGEEESVAKAKVEAEIWEFAVKKLWVKIWKQQHEDIMKQQN